MLSCTRAQRRRHTFDEVRPRRISSQPTRWPFSQRRWLAQLGQGRLLHRHAAHQRRCSRVGSAPGLARGGGTERRAARALAGSRTPTQRERADGGSEQKERARRRLSASAKRTAIDSVDSKLRLDHALRNALRRVASCAARRAYNLCRAVQVEREHGLVLGRLGELLSLEAIRRRVRRIGEMDRDAAAA